MYIGLASSSRSIYATTPNNAATTPSAEKSAWGNGRSESLTGRMNRPGIFLFGTGVSRSARFSARPRPRRSNRRRHC
ncbi:MAG: hypothetical protein VB124_05315 [Burkholderia sp.]